jgi:hypothetical protein
LSYGRIPEKAYHASEPIFDRRYERKPGD